MVCGEPRLDGLGVIVGATDELGSAADIASAVALRALAGDIPADAAHAFFALTSVRAFRDLGEQERTRRVAQVAAALHGFGVR